MHVNVLSRLFRGRFLAKLAKAHADGRLSFFGEHAALADRRAFKIFFHGEDDPVVPVNQAKMMFSALEDRSIATCLLIFQGEKHGFRQSGHVRQSLEAKLLFYAINLIKSPLTS